MRKNLKIFLVGATMVCSLNACSRESASKEEILIDERDESIVIIDESRISGEDDVIEVKSKITFDKEYLTDIFNVFKDDLLSAPDDFANSVDGLKSYFLENSETTENVKIINENYSFIDKESSARYVCKYIDNLVVLNNYNEENVNDSLEILYIIGFSDILTNYIEEEQKYIYESSYNLINNISSTVTSNNFYIINEEFTNFEYLEYLYNSIESRENNLTNQSYTRQRG